MPPYNLFVLPLLLVFLRAPLLLKTELQGVGIEISMGKPAENSQEKCSGAVFLLCPTILSKNKIFTITCAIYPLKTKDQGCLKSGHNLSFKTKSIKTKKSTALLAGHALCVNIRNSGHVTWTYVKVCDCHTQISNSNLTITI